MDINLLLYNFDKNEQRLFKNATAMMTLGIKIVDKSEYLQPVGYLVDLAVPPVKDTYHGNELTDKMLVLNNLSEEQIDNVLRIARENLPFNITYKAIVTDTNKYWSSLQLQQELLKERFVMQQLNRKKQTP